jgi:hypothetical protein
MTDEPAADYSQVYDFLYRIDRRIGYLEKDALFIEKKINTLEAGRSKHFKALSDELKGLQNITISLKNNLGQCAHGMARVGKDLKNTVKKEEIIELNNQLDEIKFEEYVTRKDIIRGL